MLQARSEEEFQSFLAAERRRVSDANQEPFRRSREPAHRLAPRLSPVLDEHAVAARIELRGRGFHAIDIELAPRAAAVEPR